MTEADPPAVGLNAAGAGTNRTGWADPGEVSASHARGGWDEESPAAALEGTDGYSSGPDLPWPRTTIRRPSYPAYPVAAGTFGPRRDDSSRGDAFGAVTVADPETLDRAEIGDRPESDDRPLSLARHARPRRVKVVESFKGPRVRNRVSIWRRLRSFVFLVVVVVIIGSLMAALAAAIIGGIAVAIQHAANA